MMSPPNAADRRGTAGDEVQAIVAEMTLDEKAALTAGVGSWHTFAVPRVGVGSVKMTDGPNGARGETGEGGVSLTPSVCIPSATALGATWDPEVVGQAAAVVARQARAKSARVLLAPTVNLHRHPLWGRNFEAFSEDPFLTGRLAVAYIQSAQAEGVIATVKHLVCNETEYERRSCSSEVDERTLRELYLLPFEMAVRTGRAQAVMTSYNRVNGRHVPDDPRILAEILRGEWGFDGIVMSDWSGLLSTVEAAQAGLDIEMPGPARAFGPHLAGAVREGKVREGDLDAKVGRLLTVFARFGALAEEERAEDPQDTPEDRAIIRRAAVESVVLLKNESALLPLDVENVSRVGLIGPAAVNLAIVGGGSARVTPHYSLSLRDALAARLGPACTVEVKEGCTLPTAPSPAAAWQGPGALYGQKRHPGDDAMIESAVELARNVDLVVLAVGTNSFWESEGYDRWDMKLPGAQEELVDRVLDANSRTVVVLNSGSPVEVPFADRALAILQCWFGGQELANALVDVLVGDAGPGGRLPVSFPVSLEHTPAYGNFPAESSAVRYGEGQLVGYRWYQARHLPTRFAFGHGLSYTTFKIGPVRLSASELLPGGTISVEVEVHNTGQRYGSEVVQFYVAPPSAGGLQPGGRLRPPKALKGFAKVRLHPGERATVTAELTERSFAYYDVADRAWPALLDRLVRTGTTGREGLHRSQDGWYLDGGTYQVEVGRSCDDICERLAVEVEGRPGPLPPRAPLG
ncbi:MAG TPA: glycoside hydrolase family 3 C-terminal domain-containing protein [Acidimicrobiales bacterium]|nr:glycoside hydrolase family 3 C-terminal domain-containing protein [Acidimicrobiales bacterium]